MLKILVDRNIEREAITHRTVMRETALKWGPNDITIHVMDRERFAPRADEHFRNEQLPYLATVGNLARESSLALFTSFELNMERMRQRGERDGWAGFSLFHSVQLGHVDPPVNRAIVISGIGPSHGLTDAEQNEFFRSIKDRRFLEMRRLLQDHHIDDAFHLWTAEHSKLDMLLTCDKRFWNAFNNAASKLKSEVKVVTPKQLCEQLGEGPTDIDALAAKYPPFH